MDALELIAVVAWAFIVSLVGGLVGLVLGNLRLPVVVLFATSPAAGAGANVGISGAAAIASAARHARSGRVNWHLFGWMAPTSLVGAIGGGLISGRVPETPLLIAIGLVVLYGAWEVYRYEPPAGDPEEGGRARLVNAATIGDLLVAGCAGGIPGAYLGAQYTGRLSERTLLNACAAILVISGAGILVQALAG